MAAHLTARAVSVSFGRRTVLDAVDLVVAPGHRIGVVAPNGTGKSTLLGVLAGRVRPDSGTVSLAPPTATVGLLPQEHDPDGGETVRSLVERRTGVAAAAAALEDATAALAAGTAGADEAYAAALETWLVLGGADLDARLGEACAAVGLPVAMLDAPVAALSGGQRARAALVATVLSRYDVLLLDEPTNDLDFAGLAVLERIVLGFEGGMVLVSHDRAFLEATVTEVLEIDEHTHRGRLYGGGWLAYLEDKAVARRHAEEAWEEYRDQRAALVGRAQHQREWAAKGVLRARKDTKEKDKHVRARAVRTSEQLASKVRISERAIERLDRRRVDKPWEGWELRMEIAAAPRSGAVVARLASAVAERGAFRLGPVDLEIGWAERIAVTGPNGGGKSTLIDLLLGRLPLAAGERWLGPGVVVGEMEQARQRFSGHATLLDAFVADTGLPAREARSLLAKFGLGAEHVERTAPSLSPGERTRASLALFMANGVNFLVLDEPTNHLDLPAIDQLEQALDGYGGTLLLVTHDRRLLESVHVTRTLRVDAGRVGSQ